MSYRLNCIICKATSLHLTDRAHQSFKDSVCENCMTQLHQEYEPAKQLVSR